MIFDRWKSRVARPNMGAVAALGLVLVMIESQPARAQFERYELGRRLRDFEVEWDRVDDAKARAKASQSLKRAVGAYFGARRDEAAKAITEARRALGVDLAPNEAVRWADSLSLAPEARLIDSSSPDLRVIVAEFYPTGLKPPRDATIRLTLGSSAESAIEGPIGPLPMTLTLPIKGLPEGDYVLVAEVRSGDKTLAKIKEILSLAKDLDDRLTALRKTIAGWPEDAESATVDRESARGQFRMLESMAAKMTLETDFPSNQILDQLEVQAEAADQSDSYLGQDRPGQFWVTLAIPGGRKVPSRVFVPESAAKGDPLPLVVALHGAGGSENLFFDGYGHGAIVDRCRERGWLLVAPRSTAFGGSPMVEIVEEIAKVYPVDRKRVMLIGHSMGAVQAVASASADPKQYAAVAALGGGGAIRAVPGLKSLPFFVGVGSEDFALNGAIDLAGTLKRAQVATVIYREYPGVEHFAIVQVALSEVFRFFDERAKPR